MASPRSPRSWTEQGALTLFVAGHSVASRKARMNLASILKELGVSTQPTVIDVLAAPEEAMQQRVFVTPALMVECAGVRQMVTGDFSQRESVVAMLRSLP